MAGKVGRVERSLLRGGPAARVPEAFDGGRLSLSKQSAAVLAMLLAPALAWAQHEHHEDAAPAKESSEAAASPTPAGTVTSSSGEATGTEEEKEQAGGFHVGLDLDHSLGSGTFVDTRYYAALNGGLSVGPSYGFKVKDVRLSASAKAGLGWEYTLPDNETGKRVAYSDIKVGLAAPAAFKNKWSGITASPSFGLTIPITPESRVATTITSLSLGVGLSRSFFEKLKATYRLTGGRSFHVNNQVMLPASTERDSMGNLFRVCRTNANFCDSTGNNKAWSLVNFIDLGYRPTDKLAFSLSFMLSSGWKEAGDVGGPDYKPKALDVNGNPVARDGMVVGNRMAGSLGASYALTDSFEVSLGLSNGGAAGGPTLTNDNKNIRFPFFDFLSPANSLTEVSLTLSASI